MYEELRKLARRDAQHCMPVKQIPNLEWEKKQTEKSDSEKKTRAAVKRNTEPTLRSSKNKQTVIEIQEEIEETTVASREQISTNFLTVTVSVAATGIYTIAVQIINTNLF